MHSKFLIQLQPSTNPTILPLQPPVKPTTSTSRRVFFIPSCAAYYLQPLNYQPCAPLHPTAKAFHQILQTSTCPKYSSDEEDPDQASNKEKIVWVVFVDLHTRPAWGLWSLPTIRLDSTQWDPIIWMQICMGATGFYEGDTLRLTGFHLWDLDQARNGNQ